LSKKRLLNSAFECNILSGHCRFIVEAFAEMRQVETATCHPIRRDLLWLLGAADPAEAIHNRLDHSEKQLKSQNRTFTKKTGSHI
jgi:hypothetical protein